MTQKGVNTTRETGHEVPVFPDFLKFPRHIALLDYKNAFCSLLLFCRDLKDPLSRSMLHSFQGSWIPPVADYFAIKAISRGISMDPKSIAAWNAFSESEREEYRKTLYSRHLGTLPPSSLKLIGCIDARARKITLLLSTLEIPENPNDPIEIESLESIDIIFAIAEDIVSILSAIHASLVVEATVS
jgi:hypothetical protein